MSLASMAFYRGLCPEDVAAASGLPTKTVDGILNGDVSLSSLSTGEQRALGHAFGLSLDGLLEAERRRESARLPQSLQLHFWDTRFDALDRKANQDQIVTRLLERAGTEGLRWVIYAYSPSELKTLVDLLVVKFGSSIRLVMGQHHERPQAPRHSSPSANDY